MREPSRADYPTAYDDPGPRLTSDTAIYRPGEIVATHERVAAPVRWHNGVLEQLHVIDHIGTPGHVEKQTEEWRTVPDVND